MGFTTHLMFCMLCVTWVFPTMTSSTCDDPLHYQKATLRKFVFLFQQLRGQLTTMKNVLSDTVDSLDGDMTDTNTELNARREDALVMRRDPMARAANATAYMKMNLAPALNVWVDSAGYSDVDSPFFTEVKLNHGFSYDSATGEAVVPIRGLYMIEHKLQTNTSYSFVSNLKVFGPTGTNIYTDDIRWMNSCPLAMVLLDLEADSVIKVGHMISSYPWTDNRETWFVRSGVRSQLTIRYFGLGASLD